MECRPTGAARTAGRSPPLRLCSHFPPRVFRGGKNPAETGGLLSPQTGARGMESTSVPWPPCVNWDFPRSSGSGEIVEVQVLQVFSPVEAGRGEQDCKTPPIGGGFRRNRHQAGLAQLRARLAPNSALGLFEECSACSTAASSFRRYSRLRGFLRDRGFRTAVSSQKERGNSNIS